MEINITRFCNNAEPFEFSASVAERGENAGQETWNNAVEAASDYMFMADEATQDAFKAYVGEFGAWSEDEINAWSVDELNALFIQLVSGDLREAMSLCSDEDGICWDSYRKMSEQGTVNGNLFMDEQGEIYYGF